MAIGRLFFEISADTSRLQESLKQAMVSLEQAGLKATRAGQATIAAFDAALNPTKALSEQIRLLEAAGRSTGDILTVMGEKIKNATAQASQHGQPIDALVRKYADMARGTGETRNVLEKLGESLTHIAHNPLEAAKQGLGSLLETMGPAAVGIGGLAAGIIGAGAALFHLSESLSSTAIQLRNQAIVTGLAVDEMQALNQLGKEAGLENENLARIIGQLNRQLATGEKADFVKVLNALRLSSGEAAADISKGVLPLLDDLQGRLLAIEDPMKRAEYQNAAFNRRQAELGIVLTSSNKKLSEQIEEVKQAGNTYGEDTQGKLLRLHTVLEHLERAWTSVKVAAIGYFASAMDWATKWAHEAEPEMSPEDLARQQMEKLKGKLDFTGYGNFQIVTPEEDALKSAEKRLAVAKAIAAGNKENLDLVIRIAEKEKEFADAAQVNDVRRAEALAPEIAGLKNLLKAYEELPKVVDRWQKSLDEAKKTQEEIDRKGHAALVPGKSEIEQGLKKLETETLERLRTFREVEASLAKDTTNSKLEELRLEERIAGTLVPMNEAERSRLEMEKIHLQFAIKAEETRVKYTQLRADLTSQINKLDPSDPLRSQAMKDIEGLTERLNTELETLGKLEGAEVLKVHRQEYLKMIDSVREGAGKVFDAISSRGKGAFQSLMDWIEGVFLSRLRVLFQNLVATLFTPNMGGQGLASRLLQGVIPVFGASGGLGGSSGVTQLFQGLGITGGPLTTAQIQALSKIGQGGAVAGGTFGFGSLLGMLGPAGLLAGGIAGVGSGNLFGRIAGTAGLGILGAAGAVTAGLIPGMGAAGIGSALGGLLTNPGMLLQAMLNPIIAVPLAAALGIPMIIKAIQGKNAWQAGAPEVARDFGGIQIGQQDLQGWVTQSLGLSESQFYPIRKDIESSPLFLTQVAAPLAQAQGKMDDFLKSLEAVKTSWGTFNFREAFETGQATGEWSDLNKEFREAFGVSKALQQAMPDWQTKLMGVEDATKHVKTATELLTDSLTALRDAVSGSIVPVKDMYQKFLETGEITEEFSAKIKELGGDIDKFKKLADLSKVNSDFQTMAQRFRDTGEILPELRALFTQFGGDLGALDAAAAIPGLKDSLSLIASLRQELGSFLPDQTVAQKIMAGQMDQSVVDALKSAGIDPEKMKNISGIMKLETGWDKAVQDFQKTGKLAKGGVLEQALLQYGGTAGQTAVDRYGQGFNTVTDQLLSSTKSALDAAYRAERSSVLDALTKVEQETAERITSLMKAVEDQFAVVGSNIAAALDAAKTEVVDVLNKILAELSSDSNTGDASSTGSDAVGTDIPAPADNTDSGAGNSTGNEVHIHMAGATIYGWDDFERRVAEAVVRNSRRGAMTIAYQRQWVGL